MPKLPDIVEKVANGIDSFSKLIDTISSGIDRVGGSLERVEGPSEAPASPLAANTPGVACVPCTEDHLSTVSSDLGEAVRLARDRGLRDPEVISRIMHARDELNGWERWDASPDKLSTLKPDERTLMDETIPRVRELRRALQQLGEFSQLEQTAARATQLRQWFGQKVLNLGECDTCKEATESIKRFLEKKAEKGVGNG